MKVIAINGSPRKKWNTAQMLTHALSGAESKGAETRLIHLYELNFKGCISCFSCKKKEGKSYGKCAVKDDLTPIFDEIRESDALVLGSPIYFGEVTGAMRSFMERLWFAHYTYENPPKSLFPKPIQTACIYTMNAPEDIATQFYEKLFQMTEQIMSMVFGHSQKLMSYDTRQFEDYSKYVAPRFNEEAKQKRYKKVFPEDCQKAYELGKSLVK